MLPKYVAPQYVHFLYTEQFNECLIKIHPWDISFFNYGLLEKRSANWVQYPYPHCSLAAWDPPLTWCCLYAWWGNTNSVAVWFQNLFCARHVHLIWTLCFVMPTTAVYSNKTPKSKTILALFSILGTGEYLCSQKQNDENWQQP